MCCMIEGTSHSLPAGQIVPVCVSWADWSYLQLRSQHWFWQRCNHTSACPQTHIHTRSCACVCVRSRARTRVCVCVSVWFCALTFHPCLALHSSACNCFDKKSEAPRLPSTEPMPMSNHKERYRKRKSTYVKLSSRLRFPQKRRCFASTSSPCFSNFWGFHLLWSRGTEFWRCRFVRC